MFVIRLFIFPCFSTHSTKCYYILTPNKITMSAYDSNQTAILYARIQVPITLLLNSKAIMREPVIITEQTAPSSLTSDTDNGINTILISNRLVTVVVCFSGCLFIRVGRGGDRRRRDASVTSPGDLGCTRIGLCRLRDTGFVNSSVNYT